ILFFTAPFIARFYSQDALISLTRVLSFVFIVNAFSFVQQTRLRKRMEFKVLTKVQIPAIIIAAIISILLAILGFGVWSLVALQLVNRFVFAVTIWIYSKWTPLPLFSTERAKSLFS